MSIFLGTGASEGIPAAFCDCPTCTKARSLGGHNIRYRSSFIIDGENMIDPGPDFYHQVTVNRINMHGLKNIFITHSHEDHISIPELGTRSSAIPNPKETVTVYASEKSINFIQDMMLRFLPSENRNKPNHCFSLYRFQTLKPFETYRIDDLTVVAIESSHYGTAPGEIGFNYLITDKDSRRFLYACDTGWYGENSWDYLRDHNVELDYLAIECTYGTWELPYHSSGHLDYANLLLFLEKLSELGCISVKTPVYVTHISHLNAQGYDEMREYFDGLPWNLIPAYDGMRI